MQKAPYLIHSTIYEQFVGWSITALSTQFSLAILIQYRHVTHRWTHDDGYYPRIASASRVKTIL